MKMFRLKAGKDERAKLVNFQPYGRQILLTNDTKKIDDTPHTILYCSFSDVRVACAHCF